MAGIDEDVKHSPPNSNRIIIPKSILKHKSSSDKINSTTLKESLLWDEANLFKNESEKQPTMKILEPKTPFVRYNYDTDQVMDLDKIPGFELGSAENNDLSRYDDIDSIHSSSSRRGSEASEKMVKVVASPQQVDQDEEDGDLLDEETRVHRKKFAEARGGHYKNEGAAMKRAQALLDDEDESSSGNDMSTSTPELPTTSDIDRAMSNGCS